jgi:hypothetical protein
MSSLPSLERYGPPPSRMGALARALAPVAALVSALLLLAGASAFVFGARRTLLDTGLWWRFGLALVVVVALRVLAARPDGLGRGARIGEALIFVAAAYLALRQALTTLLRLAA